MAEQKLVRTAHIETPLGPMVAGSTGVSVCLLEFADRLTLDAQIKALRRHYRCQLESGQDTLLTQLASELAEYFAGARREFTIPIDMRGTAFQERVWRGLLEIPFGTTCSYEDLAARTGNPSAVRAVGRANGMNRIAILVPCHRVVNKSGSLCGYAGGLWRKSALLSLERRT